MLAVIGEILDKLYIGKNCGAAYLFKSDVAEHQEIAGHDEGFDEVAIDACAK
jgi:hypothetical protein